MDTLFAILCGCSGFVLGLHLHDSMVRVLHWAFRPLRCRLGACPCRMVSTDYGVSGQCVECGKIVGFVSRQNLRKYSETET